MSPLVAEEPDVAKEKVFQEKSVAADPNSKAVLRLAKGATFTSGGKVYNKGVLEPGSSGYSRQADENRIF